MPNILRRLSAFGKPKVKEEATNNHRKRSETLPVAAVNGTKSFADLPTQPTFQVLFRGVLRVVVTNT